MSVENLLKQVEIFSPLSHEELAAVAQSITRRNYRSGQTIFFKGDAGDRMYVIEEGHVKIALASPEGKEIILAVLGGGDFFGELALIEDEPRSADAVAKEDCRLLILDREVFRRFVEAHPQAGLGLMAVLSRRLRQANELLEEAGFLDVPARLARVLLRLAETRGRAAADGTLIPGRLTQTELAGMVGATRESVNKALGLFARLGWLRHESGQLTVVNPDELRKRVR